MTDRTPDEFKRSLNATRNLIARIRRNPETGRLELPEEDSDDSRPTG